MPWLGEHDRRRHQHQPADARVEPLGGQDRKRTAETRPNQHRWRLTTTRKRLIDLIQHPGHRQRPEFGSVEVGADDRLSELCEPLLEIPRLGRSCRRREPVQVDDHNSR